MYGIVKIKLLIANFMVLLKSQVPISQNQMKLELMLFTLRVIVTNLKKIKKGKKKEKRKG